MNVIVKPIVCMRCNTLALAFFEEMPLCPHCLTAAVLGSEDPFAVGRIRPLASAAHGLKGLVKCKRNSKLEVPAEMKASGHGSFSF